MYICIERIKSHQSTFAHFHCSIFLFVVQSAFSTKNIRHKLYTYFIALALSVNSHCYRGHILINRQ